MIGSYRKLLNKKFVFDMCTHGRFIYNRYSRKQVFVKCGKCDACLQEKANRSATRIRNNVSTGTIALFITLTYANDFVPYILKSDLNGYGELNVYRRADIRQVFDRHSREVRWKKTDGIDIIGQVNQFEIDCSCVSQLHHLNGLPDDCVGVCWYKDFQDFYKRLRQILIRKYAFSGRFSYFTCSEYGGHTQRPHCHALLFIQPTYETIFRSAIVEAWPYADKSRTSRFIEVARDAASYVASYVSGTSCLPQVLQVSEFMQKHSQSKNFGVVLDCFSLRSILQKIDHGDLFYYRRAKFDGNATVSILPIPLYVLYRYFPICKGFGWLSSSQLRAILLDPAKVGDILTDFEIVTTYKRKIYDYSFFNRSFDWCLNLVHSIPIKRTCKLINPLYHYTPLETYQIYVRLENCYQRFHSETGLSRFDYAFYYERVYTLYHSMILKLSHQDIVSLDEYGDFYVNAFQVFDNPAIAPTLTMPLQLDPNRRIDVVCNTDSLTWLYNVKNKQKKVTNYVMSKNGHNV